MRGEFVDRHGNAMTVIGIVYIDPRDHWQRTMGLTDPDFPAAVEALKALIPDPVEWEITERDWPRRWNGVRVERFDEVRDMWLDIGSEETVAFEQGRRYMTPETKERGHADE